MRIKHLVMVLAAFFFVGGLHAADITITNSDFETQTISDGTWTGSITGWTLTDNTVGLFNPGVTHFSTESGSGSYGNTAYSNGGKISQVLSTDLAASTTYTLSVDVGNRLDNGFPGYALELLAGGVVLATKSGTANSIASDSFETIELTYTSGSSVTASQALEIRLSSCGTQTNFDNVVLTTGDNPCGLLVNDLIKSDVTLYVSNTAGDFATVNDALDCLSNKTIAESAIVTIQVADGTYTSYEAIYMNHPQGKQIHILGNTSDATQCKLSFASGENGVVALEGHDIGLVNGFTLDGYNDTMTGVMCYGNATIILGSEMIVEDFYSGVIANHGGFIFAAGVTSRNNANIGFISDMGANLIATGSLSDGNGANGYNITYGGSANINGSTSQNNGTYAVSVYLNGVVRAQSMTYSGNSYNFVHTATGGQVQE